MISPGQCISCKLVNLSIHAMRTDLVIVDVIGFLLAAVLILTSFPALPEDF